MPALPLEKTGQMPPQNANRSPKVGKSKDSTNLEKSKREQDEGEDFVEFGIRAVQLTSSVKATADVMREEVFRIHDEGVFFGHEPQLIRQLGISRATFRQAVRVLEHEQLLEARRGVGGGLYTRRPTNEAVAHFASIYLVAAKAEIGKVMAAIAPMRTEAARCLARNPDPEIREAPMKFLQKQHGYMDTRDYRIIQRIIGGYHKLLAELSGNPVLTLFLEIIRQFANEARWDSEFSTDATALAAYVANIHAQAAAIAAGDEHAAVRIAESQAIILASWLP